MKSSAATGFFFFLILFSINKKNIFYEIIYILKYSCRGMLTKSAEKKVVGRKQILEEKKEKVEQKIVFRFKFYH